MSRFSDHFEIKRIDEDDWFDPHLSIDTRLFVDPLLLYIEEDGEWSDAHDTLIEHFTKCYELVARGGSSTSNSSQLALRLLTFPEPGEFCLGYTMSGTSGSGSGSRFARTIADGIAIAVARGLDYPRHIEEIGILNSGIGADRVSDAVCNVLKSRFIEYTQEVARRHGIPTEFHKVRNADCLLDVGRWMNASRELPTNPVNGKPILLVPDRFLGELPTLNADDWFNSNVNADVRLEMNLTIGQKVPKSEIVRIARRHPDRVRSWAKEQSTRPDLGSYDYGVDPAGIVNWDKEAAEYALANPITSLAAVQSDADLEDLIDEVVRSFKRFVEEQGGWRLLWNENGKEKREEAVQLLFLGLAQNHFRRFGVELDREVALGRGPVDFKLSSGARIRALIEVKKLHSGSFWNGLESQLPSYLGSDACGFGWYLAVQYRDGGVSDTRPGDLGRRVGQVSEETGLALRYATVDARPKVSASRIAPSG